MTPSVNDFPLPRLPTTAATCSLLVESHTCGCRPVTTSARTPSQMPSLVAPPAPSHIPPRGLSIGGRTFHWVATTLRHRPGSEHTMTEQCAAYHRSHD